MIPGRIRVPTLTLDAKWDEDPPRHLAECRAAQEHVLRAYDRVEKELIRTMEELDAVLPRADGRRSYLHTSASRSASLNTTDNQYRPCAGRRFSRHRG